TEIGGRLLRRRPLDAVDRRRPELVLRTAFHDFLPRRAGRNHQPGIRLLPGAPAHSVFLRGDLLRAYSLLHAPGGSERLRVSGAALQPGSASIRGGTVHALLPRLDGDGGADLLGRPPTDDRLAALGDPDL